MPKEDYTRESVYNNEIEVTLGRVPFRSTLPDMLRPRLDFCVGLELISQPTAVPRRDSVSLRSSSQ